MMKVETDLGPFVSFESNDLLPSSLKLDEYLMTLESGSAYLMISSDNCG